MVPSQIDDLLRSAYSHLAENDECFFLLEYTSGKGYAHSKTNNFISNLQKNPTSSAKVLVHKKQAVATAAQLVEAAQTQLPWPQDACWMPVPPSKAPDDPEYDDRLVSVLRQAGTVNVCELITQKTSTATAKSGARKQPDELAVPIRGA